MPPRTLRRSRVSGKRIAGGILNLTRLVSILTVFIYLIETTRSLSKENRKILIKLIEIQRGKACSIDNGVVHDHSKIIKSLKLKNVRNKDSSQLVNAVNSISHKKFTAIVKKEQIKLLETQRVPSNKLLANENYRRERARVIDLEN